MSVGFIARLDADRAAGAESIASDGSATAENRVMAGSGTEAAAAASKVIEGLPQRGT